MNKADMIKAIAAKTQEAEKVFTQKDTKIVVDAMIDTIVETVAAGEEVSITGFGKFYSAEREARMGRNPQTGEDMEIPASATPKFKAGKAFKDIVKDNYEI